MKNVIFLIFVIRKGDSPMDNEKYANELLEEARAYFPLLFKKVASYRVYAPMALLIELPDRKVFLFDSLNQTSTRLPDDDNSMTKEQTGRVFGVLLEESWHGKDLPR